MSHSNSQYEWFELLVRDAKGEYRLATGDEVLKAARHVIGRRGRHGTSPTSPQMVRDYVRTKLADCRTKSRHAAARHAASVGAEVLTQPLKQALALVDVRMLDHFVAGYETVSFAERGLLKTQGACPSF